MEFAESYFEGEEREGFFVESMMKRVWAAQMEVLQEIDKVCKKHNIEWFADWGTLLGTVRHQGFVPWDDDMDIAMKRKDYQRFAEVAEKELPEGYFVSNIYKDPEFSHFLLRVVNSHEISFKKDRLEKYHGCPYVVGIDIFPLDNMPPTTEEEMLIKNLVNVTFNTAKICETEEMEGEAGEQMLKDIENLTGTKILPGISVQEQLFKLAERLCTLYEENEVKEITLMTSFARGRNYRIPKECYAKSILMPFENMMMRVPVGYDKILQVKYGDWHTPVVKCNHDYPFYKKQEEMVREHFGE